MDKRSLITAALTAFALAAPASASADIYCAPSPCGEGTPAATVPAAVTAADAHAGPDTVAIGAGTHNLGGLRR